MSVTKVKNIVLSQVLSGTVVVLTAELDDATDEWMVQHDGRYLGKVYRHESCWYHSMMKATQFPEVSMKEAASALFCERKMEELAKTQATKTTPSSPRRYFAKHLTYCSDKPSENDAELQVSVASDTIFLTIKTNGLVKELRLSGLAAQNLGMELIRASERTGG